MKKKQSLQRWALIFFLWIVACNSSNVVNTHSEKIVYRSSLSPLDALPLGNGNKIMMSDQESYIAWQVEHENIVKSLYKNRLGLLESHRRATGHLKNLKNSGNYRILDKYLEDYNALLEEFQKGIPLRILEKKYYTLAQEIHSLFQR